MRQRIKVIIRPDGSMDFAPEGFAGSKCKDITKKLETQMGKTVKSKRTAEWSAKEVSSVEIKQKGE